MHPQHPRRDADEVELLIKRHDSPGWSSKVAPL
jgi:hypothetical protein